MLKEYTCCPKNRSEEEEKEEEHREENGFAIDNAQDTVDLTYEEIEIRDYRKKEVLCYTQIAVLILIVVVCVINLSIGTGDQTAWTGMLATALGILLPQPGIDKKSPGSRWGRKRRNRVHD